MDLKVEFGKHLKELRLTNGLTQEQLAELCGCGIPHISHIESGKAFPSASLLTVLAASLGAKIHELFAFESEQVTTRKSDFNRIKMAYEGMSKQSQKLASEIIIKISKADL